jgi:hypothetical protein
MIQADSLKKKKSFLFGFVAIGLMGYTALSGSAHAGFQWTAPAAQAPTQQTENRAMPAMPAPRVDVVPAPAPQQVMPAPSIIMDPMNGGEMRPSSAPQITFETAPAPFATAPAPMGLPQSRDILGGPVAAQQPAPVPVPRNITPRRMQSVTMPVDYGQNYMSGRQANAGARPTPILQGDPQFTAQGRIKFVPTQTAPIAQPRAMANVNTMMPQPQPNFMPAPTMPVGAALPAQSMPNFFPQAVGFGSDLPLMTAVRQIIPEGYGLAFQPGVAVDGNVSWQGGKPWNVVLNEVLAPQGLAADIKQNMVTIGLNAYQQQQPFQMQPILQSYEATPITPSNAVMSQSQNTAPSPLQNAVYSPEPSSAPQDLTGQSAQSDLLQPAAAVYGGGYDNPYAPLGTNNDPQRYLNDINQWSARKGTTLREVLELWTRQSGIELYWASEFDYPIASDINLRGTFEEALQVLLKGLEESNPRPLGRLHPNLPNGPAVLVIETRRLD